MPSVDGCPVPRESYQDGWQSPQVQLLGGQAVGLTLGAEVELVLPQFLLAGEGLQTAVQADGLGLGPPALLHAAVLLHDLEREVDMSDRTTTQRQTTITHVATSVN